MEQAPPDNINCNVPQFLTKSALSRKWVCGTKSALQKSTVWLLPEEHLHAHIVPPCHYRSSWDEMDQQPSSPVYQTPREQSTEIKQRRGGTHHMLHSWVVKGSRDRCVVGRQVNIQQSKNIHTHPNRLVHLLHVLLRRHLLSFC